MCKVILEELLLRVSCKPGGFLLDRTGTTFTIIRNEGGFASCRTEQPVSVSVGNKLSELLRKVCLPHMPSVSLSLLYGCQPAQVFPVWTSDSQSRTLAGRWMSGDSLAASSGRQPGNLNPVFIWMSASLSKVFDILSALRASLSTCFSSCLYVYQPVQLFAILFEHLPAYLSVFHPVCMSTSLFSCLNIGRPVQVFFYPVCMSTSLSKCFPSCLYGFLAPVWTSAWQSNRLSASERLPCCPIVCILFEHLPACPSVCHPVWTSASLSKCFHSCLCVYQPVQVFAILSVRLPTCPSVCHPVWTSASLCKCLLSCLNIGQPVDVFFYPVCMSTSLFKCLLSCLNICQPVQVFSILSVRLQAVQVFAILSERVPVFSDEPLPACLNIYPGYERLLPRKSVSFSERRPNVWPSVDTSYMSGIHSKGWTAFLNVCCLSEPLLVFWISYPFHWRKKQVLWIWFLMFLGPPDLDPTLFVRIRIRILPSTTKKSKKPLDFYYFWPFLTFYLWRMM